MHPHAAFTAAYLEDVIIQSNAWVEFRQRVDTVLESLRQAGLTANPKRVQLDGGRYGIWGTT